MGGEPPQPVAFFKSAGFVCPELHNPADFVMEVIVSADAQAALQKQLLAASVDVKQAEAALPDGECRVG